MEQSVVPNGLRNWKTFLILHGQDVCLWVSVSTQADGDKWYHIRRNFHRLSRETVQLWVKSLTEDGVDGANVCRYDLENLADGGARVLDSIGPKLWRKVLKGGSGRLDGITAIFRILDSLQAEELTEITRSIRSIERLSLKESATQDVSSLATKVTECLHELDNTSDSAIVDHNVGQIVAQVFFVDSHFYKDKLAV